MKITFHCIDIGALIFYVLLLAMMKMRFLHLENLK